MRGHESPFDGRAEATRCLRERICELRRPHLIVGFAVVLERCLASAAGTFFIPTMPEAGYSGEQSGRRAAFDEVATLTE